MGREVETAARNPRASVFTQITGGGTTPVLINTRGLAKGEYIRGVSVRIVDVSGSNDNYSIGVRLAMNDPATVAEFFSQGAVQLVRGGGSNGEGYVHGGMTYTQEAAGFYVPVEAFPDGMTWDRVNVVVTADTGFGAVTVIVTLHVS